MENSATSSGELTRQQPAAAVAVQSVDRGETFRRFLSGSVSGTATAALLQPFDVVRTTQQGLHAATRAAVSPLLVARRLVHEQGMLALWKGLHATVIRVFFGAGIYFVALDQVSRVLSSADTAKPAQTNTTTTSSSSMRVSRSHLGSFATGALARGLAAAVMSPVSVVKTRMEFAPRGKSGMTSVANGMLSIGRLEGVYGLYAGLFATILRDAPYSGIYFMSYSALIQRIDARKNESGMLQILPPSVHNFAAALAAGGTATILTQPFDLIRTRLQLRHAASGPSQAALEHAPGVIPRPPRIGTAAMMREVVQQSGWRGLFVGASARVIKRAFSTAITWTLFEEVMRRSGGGG